MMINQCFTSTGLEVIQLSIVLVVLACYQKIKIFITNFFLKKKKSWQKNLLNTIEKEIKINHKISGRLPYFKEDLKNSEKNNQFTINLRILE